MHDEPMRTTPASKRTTESEGRKMERKRLNPANLSRSHSYVQITTIEGAKRIAYISGQTASDKDGQLIALQ